MQKVSLSGIGVAPLFRRPGRSFLAHPEGENAEMRNSIEMRGLVLGAALVFGGVVVASAGKDPSGQDLYKTQCKVCHAEGAPAGEYTPMTLIQSQWERFFEKKYEAKHAGVDFPGQPGMKVTQAISPDMLAKIRKFAVDHAADSEQPMTCGK